MNFNKTFMSIDRRAPHILLFAPHTLVTRARSGIHRVAARLIESLPLCAKVDLIKWDPIEGQPRYCDRADLQSLFRNARPPRRLGIHPLAHTVDYRFADTLEPDEHVVLLMAETFYLCPNGNEMYARLLAQSAMNGWTTAAIFYDLIPLKFSGYEERDVFARYIAELARVDVVIPISRYSEQQLRQYWAAHFGLDDERLSETKQEIVAIPLADQEETGTSPETGRRDSILLLGTIEPRKQQTRVIRAFKKMRLAERAGLSLVIVGGLNPRSETEFRALIADDSSIHWRGFASDEDVELAFASARFSVFASHEEGFGLPIVESLCRGVPCLTADQGAMREAAEGGGCLLVDVEDDSAIEEGLLRLAYDDALLERLRLEINGRRWRNWRDYAAEIVDVLSRRAPLSHQASAAADLVANELVSFSSSGAGATYVPVDEVATGLPPVTVTIVDGRNHLALTSRQSDISVVALSPRVDPRSLPEAAFNTLVAADAWCCRGRDIYERVVARASAPGRTGLLSGVCAFDDKADDLVQTISQQLSAFFARRMVSQISAKRDEIYRRASRSLGKSATPRLTLVISSYNRADFIERNIRHCLDLIRPLGNQVELVVVDNASTDGTSRIVEPFAERGELQLVQMASNTGLLGNLHQISTLVRARHVWAIGVDDILLPDALTRILGVLDADPACPLIVPNFAVYHRETVGAHDTCAALLGESRTVGQNCRPDGMTSLCEATSQHDNLLTAFYLIIFRSDLMAAIFNSPFTAPFFGSLYDTVPTTKVIFEAMSEFATAWLAEPVVAGNGHNTWRHHRVRWHGVLMPLAFELAREAGLDPVLLREWARQHVDLLKEAEDLYPDANAASPFTAEELDASFRVFGKAFPGVAAYAEPEERGRVVA